MGEDPEAGAPADAETLWGQVELQNAALHQRLKRSVKQLGKQASSSSSSNAIRLLEDIPDSSSSEGESGSDNNDGTS